MQRLAPVGDVYQAGTLSGNPLAMAAGAATLRLLAAPGAYDELEATAAALEQGLREAAAGQPVTLARVGSMLTLFFGPDRVRDYDGARRCDTARYGAFFRDSLAAGVYLAPSQFEVAFVSLAHAPQDVEATVEAARAHFAGGDR
jgi:glutamate-1-semialdehyde 2,1-aminomutase